MEAGGDGGKVEDQVNSKRQQIANYCSTRLIVVVRMRVLLVDVFEEQVR